MVNQEETHIMGHATVEHIGDVLRALREQYAYRLGATTGCEEPTRDLLGADAHVQALVAALAVHGYPMSIADYLAMENDGQLSDGLGSFVRAFAGALSLSSEESRMVLTKVAYVLLCGAGGEEFAGMCLQHIPLRRETVVG